MSDEVLRFAKLMQSRIDDRNEKYQGKTWKDATVESLFTHLQEEVKELTEAIQSGGTFRSVKIEAVDVANMAMMIVDVCGGLEE